MFATYDHCLVTHASLTLDFECNTADSTWMCGVLATDGAALDSSVADSNGFRVARRSIFKHAKNGNGEQSPMRRLRYNIDVAKFFGLKRGQLFADKYSHTETTNPDEQVYFNIVFGALDDRAATIPAGTVKCYINYTCVFSEPKEGLLA